VFAHGSGSSRFSQRNRFVAGVLVRGGFATRPDLVGEALARVLAPTLLIVGGDDTEVIRLNQAAMRQMHAPVQLAIVPGATHLFEEAGALEQVCGLALDWCRKYLHIRPGEHVGAVK
jgi:pimeloyl-ACP methyl ester carboxylesterase